MGNVANHSWEIKIGQGFKAIGGTPHKQRYRDD
jgi:hypothetical protein